MRRLCSTALLTVALATPAFADEPARQLLTRMSEALATRNYSGTFLHSSGGQDERLRIAHRVRDGRVSERLGPDGGGGREVVRDGDEITVYLPDRRLAVIERRARNEPLLGTLPQFGPDVERWYELQRQGRDTQVLGGGAQVILVRPRDRYRFGYRLWIDERTHMPVRTELLDDAGRAIERVEFSALELRRDIPDDEFEPLVDASNFRWVRQAPHPATRELPWRVAAAPPGFKVAATQYQSFQGASAPVPHLVVSDGLASVSVFIEPGRNDGTQPKKGGVGRMGSSSAYTTTVDGHQVTAVGEVPTETVQAIAIGLKPVARDSGR